SVRESPFPQKLVNNAKAVRTGSSRRHLVTSSSNSFRRTPVAFHWSLRGGVDPPLESWPRLHLAFERHLELVTQNVLRGPIERIARCEHPRVLPVCQRPSDEPLAQTCGNASSVIRRRQHPSELDVLCVQIETGSEA